VGEGKTATIQGKQEKKRHKPGRTGENPLKAKQSIVPGNQRDQLEGRNPHRKKSGITKRNHKRARCLKRPGKTAKGTRRMKIRNVRRQKKISTNKTEKNRGRQQKSERDEQRNAEGERKFIPKAKNGTYVAWGGGRLERRCDEA